MKKAFPRGSKRGTTVGEVLIVVAIRAAIAGVGAMVAIPEHNRAHLRLAALGAANIRQAVGIAEL